MAKISCNSSVGASPDAIKTTAIWLISSHEFCKDTLFLPSVH